MGVKLVTDSTAYLPDDTLAQYDISVVSLSVIMEGAESVRELDLDYEKFYRQMETATEIPTSSQPSIAEMYQSFEKVVAQGDDLVAVFISSKFSGTYSTAVVIKGKILEAYPEANIEIIDSGCNCMQLGYMVLEGAKAAWAGQNLASVVEKVQSVGAHSRFLFTPEVLDYLKKGGRIGGASALMGNLLQIKPILTVEHGETAVFAKVRTKKKAVQTIVETMLADLSNHQIGGVMVHHINCADEGLALAKQLEEKVGIPVQIQSIGPIIGVHVGPGSIGVVYWWY